MEKSADAFRTISEVAADLDLPQHVLRFWETRFAQIKPLKRAGGRRFYRPDDIELLRAIRQLLYGQGYTIKGVQRILKEQGARALIAASRTVQEEGFDEIVTEDDSAAMPGSDMASDPGSHPEMPAIETSSPPIARTHAPDLRLTEWAEMPPADRDAAAPPLSPPQLSAADRQRLQAVLADLVECERLLEAARHV